MKLREERAFLEAVMGNMGYTKKEEAPMSNLPATLGEATVIPITPEQQIKAASDMARLLKDVVSKAGLAKKLGGKKEHLEFEAWQTIARWHHCTPSTEWTRPIKDGDKIIGWEARVNVIDETGRVIGSSEGMCMADEQNWKGKPSYALRSMAQTRTAGKALRSLFAHIAVLAGYSPTPAEEMDGVDTHYETHTTPPDKPKETPKQAPPADDNQEQSGITFIPSAITLKEGVNQKTGKSWTKYTVHCGDERYSTFDKKHAEIAKSANLEGKQVYCVFSKDKYGKNIEVLKMADEIRQPGDEDTNYPQ